jgi:small subunit ribosomal protein S1
MSMRRAPARAVRREPKLDRRVDRPLRTSCFPSLDRVARNVGRSGLYFAVVLATNDLMQQEPGVWVVGSDGELIPDYESTFPEINEGQVVHGTVVRVDKDEVLVDIGYKSEGVIPVSELSIRRSVNPADEVTIGDEIDALVLIKEDADGRLILSKKRARFELAWKNIERAAESGDPVNGRVIEVVKGGLILDLGVRGFLPASLVDIRRVQDLDEFLGQELRCKVIELNRSRNNVVLSRRAVLEEERKEQRQQILDRLQPGDVVSGEISNIVDFGAFVDLDGMDGLIHISELSWSHVNHPSEVLHIGQTVEVKVLDIDRERQRISLGLKQTQSDPWQQVIEHYHENDVVEGRVTKVVTFGAFVEILSGVEGLVHISELAQHHVENPREVVSQGQAVNVKIIEVDGERRRLSLSLKRIEPDDEVQPRADGGPSVYLTPNLEIPEADDSSLPESFEEEYGPPVDAPAPDVTAAEVEDVPGLDEAKAAAADEPAAVAEVEADIVVAQPAVAEPEAAPAEAAPAAAAGDADDPAGAAVDEPAEPEAGAADEEAEPLASKTASEPPVE